MGILLLVVVLALLMLLDNMAWLMIGLVIAFPVIALYRLASGDKYMPPQDRWR